MNADQSTSEQAKLDAAAVAAQQSYQSNRRSPVVLVIVIAVIALAAGMLLQRAMRPKQRAAATTQTTDAGPQLWTCSMHPQVIHDHPGDCPICHMALTPVKSQGAALAGVVTIDPVIVQNMGVRTAEVRRGPLTQTIRTVGYFQEPEPLHRDINLRVSGWIEKLQANIDGMSLEKGQPLFELYSPELTVAVDELIAARKQRDASTGDASAKSLLETARQKLLQYGLAAEQLDALAAMDSAPRTIPILAPLSGHLTKKMVNEGAAVKAGDLVMRIASRHTMWVDAQVYEQQLPFVHDGQAARITTESLPGKTLGGKIMFIHPHLDTETRTAMARIEVPNDNMQVREGMFATVEIDADPIADAVLIPEEAVIDTGARQIAFVVGGEGTFVARTIKLGRQGSDGTREVLSGVSSGERIVTSGQFLIDSESRLREAMAKHSSQGLVHPASENEANHAGH